MHHLALYLLFRSVWFINLVLQCRLCRLCFGGYFNFLVAALQPVAGVDRVCEGAVPWLQAAQVPEQQGAPATGGGPHGATGEAAADASEGTAVSRASVSLIA